MKVGIVGLGLIGGSLGLSLKESGYSTEIWGFDSNADHMQLAMEKSLIDKAASTLKTLVESVDIVVLAVPVQTILRLLPDVLDLVENQIVIDVGSTKLEIVNKVKGHPKRSRYLPTHPMAGTEFSGPQAAVHRLFEGKVCVFCDVDDTDALALEELRKLYAYIGMDIVEYQSMEHDVHTAYVSHISHISSIALALTVLEKEKNENRIFELASGGFSSTVRLAKSNPDTWIPIFEQNRDNVLDVLDEHINVISQFRTLLIKKNFKEFYALMERANDIKKILK